LSATELHLKFQLRDSGKKAPLDTNTNIAVVNNFLHSIFEQCQVYLNNVAVENTNKCYAYRSYLENLLCYNNDAKQNLLRGDFFFPEDKKASTFAETNDLPQLTMKYASAANETPVEYEAYGKIHCDIFNINKYMLNNIILNLYLLEVQMIFVYLVIKVKKQVF